MKSLILTFFFAFCINICIQVQAQEDYRMDIPQRAIKPTISVPKFLDSNLLINDIKQLKILKKIYLELERDNIGYVYMYAFYIDKNGDVILGRPEPRKLYKEINRFVESKFSKYHWSPSYKLNCKKCPVKTHGVFTFDFDPEKKYILCYIDIMNEKIYHVFYERINMQ